jgi:hypothetical protein
MEFQIYESDFTFADRIKAEVIFREFMEDVADVAVKSFQRHVPFDSGRTWEAISASPVNKTPYGYTVSVGIEPIVDLMSGESEIYPVFVHEGTGMFSDDPHWIVPQHGNVMVFDVYDAAEESGWRTVVTRNTEGQEAQPYLDTVEGEVNAYIRLKKREVARLLNS